ncbi:FHA domain-containing protein [Dictyobacter formicarum]|uniref:FHA domain-containing protein n=1 Tax=Dictyobacter formicarum TaxID=2778368 RepID=A0ABQ3VNG6_9CHLR|nr:FHA domain-containing protein [Dictyobacter formicarum]GHO87785.1 hypothetical protein KSZ_57910 [Dictyobacter formicarum]
MDKCPYCGAETRQGDNFCLNCGNRLLPATPSPSSGQQAQPGVGEATVAAADEWNSVPPSSAPASGQSWGVDLAAPTAFGSPSDAATVREPAGTAQATMDRISEPGMFILRSDNGDVIQEYPLDKTEIVIGRAPTSDILLSKDKLTSRRHATVRYENNQYLLHDEHSANGTFVNGQQLEEATPYALQDGDQVGIGEHELLFRAHGAQANVVEDLPTISEPQNAPANPDFTYRTQNDEHGTISENDDYGTATMDSPEESAVYDAPAAETAHVEPPATPAPEEDAPISHYEPVPAPAPVQEEPAAPIAAHDVEESVPMTPGSIEKTPYAVPSSPLPAADSPVTFSRFSALSSPSLPDMSALMAALSSLDGQIMSLQEQFNATQDAMRNHDAEVNQTASQLRSGIRRVSDRMDSMIADVARSREALAWAELLQLMEDVMNNPRDIEYVTKLARKARELNKVFQIHQNVLNTMAECNSLLRSLIGEEK